MYAKLALAALLVAAVVSTPVPGGHHKKVTIHVPYKIHTVHHHHVEKVHVPVHVPVVKEVIKEVPVIKEVEVIKHVPVEVIKHVPIVKHVEKKVFIPVHEEHHDHHEWQSESSSHGWN